MEGEEIIRIGCRGWVQRIIWYFMAHDGIVQVRARARWQKERSGREESRGLKKIHGSECAEFKYGLLWVGTPLILTDTRGQLARTFHLSDMS